MASQRPAPSRIVLRDDAGRMPANDPRRYYMNCQRRYQLCSKLPPFCSVSSLWTSRRQKRSFFQSPCALGGSTTPIPSRAKSRNPPRFTANIFHLLNGSREATHLTPIQRPTTSSITRFLRTCPSRASSLQIGHSLRSCSASLTH